MASSATNHFRARTDRFRQRATLGPLPDDFLTVSHQEPAAVLYARQQQEQTDHEMAAQLQLMNRTQPLAGRLRITVVQAKLHKNYGMTRMDPYVRLHIGRQVFETQTDPNGAKAPVWNKTFYLYQMPEGFTTFHLEVFDERTLTDDERIAWATIPLPRELFQGEVIDNSYDLSGKLGDKLEGSIHLIMFYEAGVVPQPVPLMVYPTYPAIAQYPAAVPVVEMQNRPRPLSDDEFKEVCSMFPDMEVEVVRSVLEASLYNKQRAVEALLAMQAAN